MWFTLQYNVSSFSLVVFITDVRSVGNKKKNSLKDHIKNCKEKEGTFVLKRVYLPDAEFLIVSINSSSVAALFSAKVAMNFFSSS